MELLSLGQARIVAVAVAGQMQRKNFYRYGLIDALEEAAFGLPIERAVDQMEDVLASYKLGDMGDPCDEWPIRIYR